MRSRLLFALCVLAALGGSCAQSSGAIEEGEGGGGDESESGSAVSVAASSTSASSGSGGGGDSGASSGATEASSASSSAASSGSGGGCAESPCKLVTPQCGCDADEQCSLDGSLERACVPAGMVAAGKECNLVNRCAPGLLCVTPGGADVSICEKFCDADGQCQGPGGLCVITLDDGGGGTLQDVTLCSENCDPSSASSCPVAGTGCTIAREAMGQMRFFTSCAGAGAGMQNASCTANSDCAPSFGCFAAGGANDECLKYCKVNSPMCPGAATCVPIQVNSEDVIIGNEQYGACL